MDVAHMFQDVVDDVQDLVKRQGILDGLNSLLSPVLPRQQPKGQITVTAVTTMTAPKTFSGDAVYVTQTGNAVAGGAVFQTNTAAATTSDPASPSSTVLAAASTVASTTQRAATSTANTASSKITTAPTVIAPTASQNNLGALNSASASATPQAVQQGGLSGGAKAGIAFGVLIPLAALLFGLIFLLRRRKQKKDAGVRLSDSEKTPLGGSRSTPGSSIPELPGKYGNHSPPSNMQMRPLAKLPRLSLRPLTQFDPRMSKFESPKTGVASAYGAGALAAGAAGAAAVASRSQSPRVGQQQGGDISNPFGDHARNNASQAHLAGVARAPSATNSIHASDFPLPASGAPSEKAISLQADQSVDNLSLVSSKHANDSSYGPSGPEAAAAAGIIGAGAAVAAGKSNAAPIVDNVYRVQLDFKPSMEDELEIRAGQLVRCLHEYDDGWALCMRMDRSQQGVVPRTCLSKNTVKPRQGPPPGMRPGAPRGPPRGPGMRGPPGPGRPMTPNGTGMTSPGYPPQGRPMTPNGSAQGRTMTPQGGPAPPFAQSPAGSPRVNTSSPAPGQYTAYNPQASSPMAPKPEQVAPVSEAGQQGSTAAEQPKPLSPTVSTARKPVAGQAV